MGVFLPVKTVSALVNRWYDQKKYKNGAAHMDCTAKYDLFKLYSARKAKIYSLYCFHLLQRFAMRFFRRTPWMIKYAASSNNGTHADNRICINAALRFDLSHSESVKRLVSSERLMNARPFESVSTVGYAISLAAVSGSIYCFASDIGVE